MAAHVGLPFLQRQYLHLVVNGVWASARGVNAGTAFTNSTKVFEDTQQPDGDFLEQWFPDRDGGELFKLDVWYETSSDAVHYYASDYPRLINYLTSGGMKKQASYRWTWRKRSDTSSDSYAGLYTLIDTLTTTNAGLAYTAQISTNLDVEQWMRVFALEDAIGNGDSFGN